DGTTVAILIAVAIVLGLRHATDPDHLAAVTTLIAGGKERTKSAAARLGFAWGLGHALTLFAFGLPIGLVHGMGGSAGVGVLLLAAIHDRAVAVLALGLFAFFTAVSMAVLSTGFGLTLSSEPVRRSFDRVAPALGAASLLFGVWYALGALAVTPYYF